MSADSEYRVDEQLLGDVESLLSFWPMVRENPEIGPREAMRVLATWSHLQRFSPDLLDQEIVGKLNDAVQGDAAKLVDRFSELTFIEDWINDSEALDESWDWILDNDAADEADLSSLCLFDVLDRFSLACHASRKLLPEGSAIPEGLSALIEEMPRGKTSCAITRISSSERSRSPRPIWLDTGPTSMKLTSYSGRQLSNIELWKSCSRSDRLG